MSNTPNIQAQLKELRPGSISITGIYGVETLPNGKLIYHGGHPDFPNPKSELRPAVLDDLASASDPSQIPAIDIYNHNGDIVVVDGGHRVENAVTKYNENPEVWGKIRVNRVTGNLADAQTRAFAANLHHRDGLTESEVFAGVKRFIDDLGWSKDEVLARFSKLNKRIVGLVDAVIYADPAVGEAVLAGKLSLAVAGSIAKNKDLGEQTEAVEKAIALEAKGSSNVRAEIGTRKARVGLGSIKDVNATVFGDPAYWETILDDVDDSANRSVLELLQVVYGKQELTTDQFITFMTGLADEYDAMIEAERQKTIEYNRKRKALEDAKLASAKGRNAKREKELVNA